MDTIILSDFGSNLSYSGLHHIVWVKKENVRALSIFFSYLNILYNNPHPELATYLQRKKLKMFQIKIRQDLPQGELSRREERLRKPFLCFYVFMRTDFLLGQIKQREERLREKKKMFRIKIYQDLPHLRKSGESDLCN